MGAAGAVFTQLLFSEHPAEFCTEPRALMAWMDEVSVEREHDLDNSAGLRATPKLSAEGKSQGPCCLATQSGGTLSGAFSPCLLGKHSLPRAQRHDLGDLLFVPEALPHKWNRLLQQFLPVSLTPPTM